MPRVGFDESGYSGQALLDPNQRVFTLVSVCLDDADVVGLLQGVPIGQAREAKFTDLVRTAAGRESILSVLQSPLIRRETVKLSVYDLPFMATQKMVDLLAEPVYYEGGMDLYDNGHCRALSNVWHIAMRAIIGEDAFRRLQHAFVEMMRQRTPVHVNAFYDLVWEINGELSPDTSAGVRDNIWVLLKSHKYIGGVLTGFELTQLDPVVPAFVTHCACWTGQLRERFTVLLDTSKPIRHEAELLTRLNVPDGGQREWEFNGENCVLPSSAVTPFRHGNSIHNPVLQVTDIIAGSGRYWATGAIYGDKDVFWHALVAGGIQDLIIETHCATHQFTPEDLGTEGVSHADFIEHVGTLVIT